MNARNYAQAIHELSLTTSAGKSGIVSRVVALLKQKGHTHLLPRIVRELERIEARAARTKVCDVRYAVHAEHAAVEKEAHKFIKARGEDPDTWTYTYHLDPALIGGYTIRTRETERDGSYRSSLYQLYLRLKNA